MRLIDVKSMKTICYFPKKVYYAEVVVFAKSSPRINSWATEIYYHLFI